MDEKEKTDVEIIKGFGLKTVTIGGSISTSYIELPFDEDEELYLDLDFGETPEEREEKELLETEDK